MKLINFLIASSCCATSFFATAKDCTNFSGDWTVSCTEISNKEPTTNGDYELGIFQKGCDTLQFKDTTLNPLIEIGKVTEINNTINQTVYSHKSVWNWVKNYTEIEFIVNESYIEPNGKTEIQNVKTRFFRLKDELFSVTDLKIETSDGSEPLISSTACRYVTKNQTP